LAFVGAYDLMSANNLFKKEDHLVTFRNGLSKTQIGYFLIRANSRTLCKDCKVISNECLGTQHRLVVMDVVIKKSKRRGKKKCLRT